MKLPFKVALYKTLCEVCHERLDWEAAFDADGTTWSADCCGYTYHISIETVDLIKEETGEG